MKRQILIVDDDATIRALLETHFTARGFTCQVASEGNGALAILRGGQIQVLITDLDMPGIDGVTLLRSVRTLGLMTRCVVVTGYATITNLTACLREGAVALVPKPLDNLVPLDQAVEQAFEQMQRWSDQMSAIIRLRPSPPSRELPAALDPRSGHAR